MEHHTSGHQRLDGHGANDADRRTRAHVSDKIVRARRNQDLVDGAVADGLGELRHGAHRDFAQMPAVQYERRHIGTGPCGRSCWVACGHPAQGRAVFQPLVLPGRRGLRVGAKGGGTGAGDSEEEEDAEAHSTQRRLVVEMGNPVGTACWPGGGGEGVVLDLVCGACREGGLGL